jgi:hypothetical protein
MRTTVPVERRGLRKLCADSMTTPSPGASAASCSALRRFSAATVTPPLLDTRGEAAAASQSTRASPPIRLLDQRRCDPPRAVEVEHGGSWWPALQTAWRLCYDGRGWLPHVADVQYE